jgi:hypothetical protein
MMDSGATDHIYIKENFKFIEPYKSTDRRLKVKRIGYFNVETMTSNEKMMKITIKKVLYVTIWIE